MENSLVSARIVRAKKERGVGILEEIGATTSDLINSAFDYVIERKELPTARAAEVRGAQGFAAFVQGSTLPVEWPDGFEGDYKSLAARMRTESYEALS